MIRRLPPASLFMTRLPSRWFYSLLGIFLLLTLAISLEFTYRLYRDHLEQQYEALSSIGQVLSIDFDHELAIQAFSIETLEAAADELLNNRGGRTESLTPAFQPFPQHQGYALQLPFPGLRFDIVGALTGAGSPPRNASALAREIEMAIALTPIFKPIQRRSSGLTSIYYLSARGFIYLYPGLPPERFFFSADLLTQPMYLGATPDANLERQRFWTPVHRSFDDYDDALSVCKPIYREESHSYEEEFMGSLCIDVPLSMLVHLLENHQVPEMHTHLIDDRGRTLIKTGHAEHTVVASSNPSRTPTRQGEMVVAFFPLETKSGWQIAIDLPYEIVHQRALAQAVPPGAVVFSVGLLLTLLLALGRAYATVRNLSLHDGLTGAFNRRHFDTSVGREFARLSRASGHLGLALIDVDHFKLYNDHYGHQAGDRVLRQVSMAIAGVLKRESDRLFRVGGEEFAVLVHCRDEAQLVALFNLIKTAIAALEIEHACSPHERITISIGGVLLRSGAAHTAESAYQAADAALYEAKAKGRNQGVVGRLPPPQA